MSVLLRYERRQVDGRDDPIITLHLHQAERPLVVLDRALLESIDATLDAILDETAGRLAGFVLASDSRVFVAGADLKQIMGLDDPGLHEYLAYGSKVYGRIATLPCTTVAAINGAALGGGLEIAMHCDHLIAAAPQPKEPGGEVKPYQVGLPEAGLKICPGWGGTTLLPARMDAARAFEMTATGRTMTVHDAAEAGLIEEFVEPAALLDRAATLAATPKATPRREPVSIAEPAQREAAQQALAQASLPDDGPGEAIRACAEAGLRDGWQAALACEREWLVRLRNTDAGRGAIEAFFARTAAR
jgi:enoyl-CoA hydratase/carnithine racemase